MNREKWLRWGKPALAFILMITVVISLLCLAISFIATKSINFLPLTLAFIALTWVSFLLKWPHWVKLALAFIAMIAISFLLAHWFNRLLDYLNLPLDRYAFLAYLLVFVVSLVANLTVMAPVPIALTVMITVAQTWNPALAALAAAVGGSLGELSGYFAGLAGRKITLDTSLVSFARVGEWIQRWGAWAITFMAFQPILPFDIGGLIAGAARMPIYKFLPALFIGKLPKYLIIAYVAVGVIGFLPPEWFG
ncbi:MAG: VTT domain-containing protein [Dehalococcoidia bacterium]|nr:VTT domain-containing protein [Dehalococcoidia bacterium]